MSSALFMSADCGGGQAPADPPALILHGAEGGWELAADAGEAALAEVDSLMEAKPEPLFLAVEPAALEAARKAGALELRWPTSRAITLSDDSSVEAAGILIPLTDEPEALKAGEASTLLVFLDEAGRIVGTTALARSREFLVAALPAPASADETAGFASPLDEFLGTCKEKHPEYAREFDTPANPVERARAEYPDAARKKDREGTVYVVFFVNEAGEVFDIISLREDVDPSLVEAAMSAAAQWRFEPARKDGRPVKSTLMVPFQFQIK